MIKIGENGYNKATNLIFTVKNVYKAKNQHENSINNSSINKLNDNKNRNILVKNKFRLLQLMILYLIKDRLNRKI